MTSTSRRCLLLLATLVLLPVPAHAAWWNDEWTGRKPLRIDLSPTGANLTQPVGPAAVLIRLVPGNFNFAAAKPDGSDLRFVAGDDKTPLKFHFEKYDSLLGEALVWVGLPELKAGARTDLWLYYGNPKAAPAEDVKGTYDPATLLVYHFSERGQPPRDSSASGLHAPRAAPGTDALIGSGLQLDGHTGLELPTGPQLAWAAGASQTWSLWVKPEEAEASGVVLTRRDGVTAFTLGLEKGKPFVQVEREGGLVQRAEGSVTLPAKAWHHLAVTAGEALTVYVDGVQAATLATGLPALATPVYLGGMPPEPAVPAGEAPPLVGFTGDLDELQVSKGERPPGSLLAAFQSQGTDSAKFLSASGQDEEASSWSGGYLAIIIRSVTLDGWVVIGLLAVMFTVSVLVMISKAGYLARVEKANGTFADRFRAASGELMALVRAGHGALGDEKALRDAPLFRLFRIVMDEVRKRTGTGRALSAESIEAIRASLDSGLVRENQRLSERMVLLTIAISGGPFLGLLGTVVGVMITFASIAAAGDVNVNAIAPGIAAALVATVAGLAVAIPALFAYNWLLARIKNVTATMQVFADELVTTVAEQASQAHAAGAHAALVVAEEVAS